MFTMAPRTRQPQRRPPGQHPLTPDVGEPLPTDGRRVRGLLTRNSIVAEAVQLASTDGLNGLTMAVLADRLGVPKSSVHAAFGSKQDLQLAVLSETRRMLIELVVSPSLRENVGAARLVAIGESWIGYLESGVFQGGCVLSAAASEIDAKSGAVRDSLAAVMSEWLKFLADNARAAIKRGEFRSTANAEQIAFELHAIGLAANWHYQLFGERVAFKRGRASWTQTLVTAGHDDETPEAIP